MTQTQIAKMTVDEFVTALAAKQPVPGGGAAAACILAQASALGSMVIAYTLGKPKFAQHQSRLENLDMIFTGARIDALDLADRDANAYLTLNSLWKIPADQRSALPEWHAAVNEAIAAPSAIADLSVAVLAALATMSKITSAQLASDLRIAQLFAHTAMESALLNVQVNLPQVSDTAARIAGEAFLTARRSEGARFVSLSSTHS